MNSLKNLKLLNACVVGLLLAGCGGGGTEATVPSDPTIPTVPTVQNPVISFLGTNYAVSTWGTAGDPVKEAQGFEKSWYYPALNLRSVIGSLNTNEAQVYEHLQTMRTAGANAIAFPIWYDELRQENPSEGAFYLANTDGVNDGVFGHIIDSTGGTLRPQHIENYKWLIKRSFGLGFSRVYIRFNQNNDVVNNKDEAKFQRAVAIRLQLRDIARETYKESFGQYPTDQIQFDLGGEELTTVNVADPVVKSFLQRFWKIWIALPGGLSDTVGYSMIAGKAQQYRTLWDEVYLPANRYPDTIAIDAYPSLDTTNPDNFRSMEEALTDVASKLQDFRPVDILETYWNSKETGDSIRKFSESSAGRSLKINSVLTWQLVQNSPTAHFSREGALAPLEQKQSVFAFYLNLLTGSN